MPAYGGRLTDWHAAVKHISVEPPTRRPSHPGLRALIPPSVSSQALPEKFSPIPRLLRQPGHSDGSNRFFIFGRFLYGCPAPNTRGLTRRIQRPYDGGGDKRNQKPHAGPQNRPRPPGRGSCESSPRPFHLSNSFNHVSIYPTPCGNFGDFANSMRNLFASPASVLTVPLRTPIRT